MQRKEQNLMTFSILPDKNKLSKNHFILIQKLSFLQIRYQGETNP